jgi:hypothetical protein
MPIAKKTNYKLIRKVLLSIFIFLVMSVLIVYYLFYMPV